MKIALLLIAAFASCSGERPTKCDLKLSDNIRTCAAASLYTVNGLNGTIITSVSEILTMFGHLTKERIHVMCTNKGTIDRFHRCAHRELSKCNLTLGRASPAGFAESISYLCDNAEDVNFTCPVATGASCYDDLLRAETEKPISDSYLHKYACEKLDEWRSCLKDAWSHCPGRTAEVRTKILEYQKPAVCSANMVEITWGLLVISLCYTWFENII